MGASLARLQACLASVGGFVHFAGDVRVRAELLENFRKIPAGFALAVKPVNRLFDFGRVGHDDLHVAFDGKVISSACCGSSGSASATCTVPLFNATGRH
jgi:hypothetical protein